MRPESGDMIGNPTLPIMNATSDTNAIDRLSGIDGAEIKAGISEF